MRQCRRFPGLSRTLAATVLITGFATGAPAQDVDTDDVIWLLQSEGYEVTEISRTLLGRIRIAATNGAFDREVIISRTTGEIRYDGVYAKLPGTVPQQDPQQEGHRDAN
ncbi:MAG: hypothetical protein AAF771_15705 [Pseudomonadota bacterium]